MSNAYQVTVRDSSYLASVIDVLYVRASTPEGAIKKTRQHARTVKWEGACITEVKRLDGTVVP